MQQQAQSEENPLNDLVSGDAPDSHPDSHQDPQTTSTPSLSKFDRINVVEIPRSQLNNAPYNPRKISPSALIDLRKSLQNHGLVETLIWNERTGNLVGGHQRLSQLDILEGSPNYSIHVNKVDIDERAEVALNIALNNPGMQGEYDIPAMIDLLREDKFDLDLTGFKPIDFEMMALDSGLDTTLVSSMFTPEAIEQVNSMTADIDAVLDQSDQIRKRKAAQSQPLRRQQPQDEDDDQIQSEVRGTDGGSRVGVAQDHARYPEPALPITPNQSHTATANGPALPADSPYNEEYFGGRKQRESESTKAQREHGYFLTLVFPSNEQKFAFCKAIGASERTPYFDGPTVAGMIETAGD